MDAASRGEGEPRAETYEALARALEEERRERRHLLALDRLTDVVLGASDARRLLAAAAQALVPAFADWCTVHYVPGEGEARQIAVAAGDPAAAPWGEQLLACLKLRPAGEPAVSRVMAAARSELVDPVDGPTMAKVLSRWVVDVEGVLEAVDRLGVASVLSVPLLTRRGVRGALWMVDATPARRFDPDTIATLELAASRISEGLDNVLTAEQHRHISATLQRALLPPVLPEVDGVEVAVRYWPAGLAVEAGGDFYDLFALDERSWAVLIGDVCGTGPDAAALTGIARHTVRAAVRHGQDHRSVLEWLNEAVLTSNRDRFCTAVYGTLECDADAGWSLTTCSAGHPLPILVRPGEPARPLGRPGTLVGAFERIDLTVERTPLRPGDLVVLYTDGVTDLPPPALRTADDLVELLSGLAEGLGVEEVAEEIGRWTAERIPPSDRGDDVALVVLRVG